MWWYDAVTVNQGSSTTPYVLLYVLLHGLLKVWVMAPNWWCLQACMQLYYMLWLYCVCCICLMQQGLLHAGKPASTKSQREPNAGAPPPSTTTSTTSGSSSSMTTASSTAVTLSSPPATSCTMTVELQSKERVSARGKRRTESSFMLHRCAVLLENDMNG